MEETAVIANLPNLEIKVAHRVDPEDGAEIVAVQIKAFPSFDKVAEAMARDLHPLLAGGLFPAVPLGPAGRGAAAAHPAMMMRTMMTPWMEPLRMWSVMAERFWGAWLAASAASLGGGRR